MSPSDRTLDPEALALLDEALEQPSRERLAWIQARTPGGGALRARVLSLLGAAQRGSDALGTGGAGADLGPDIPPPERIGAYRIMDRLGQGGMGAVYRAERDTGDFKHTVAIKIIRPGVLSEALVERFQRERQTLADLSHPHIARLFDGGETADGQPFIIMEYVAGQPITAFAWQHKLDTRGRLKLFLQACEAVRFAHQNLIIHRDLTPANVLVTADGAVKLIDFGIARPPQMEVDDLVRGSLAGLSLTPGYAAPERMTGVGASTLVDVFSLGRLLETLLDDQPADADLLAIARKAAAHEPEDRYASVDALIDDLQRYEAGRTVAARGGGRRYAFGKFVRRHSRAVTASTAAVALLIAALAVTLFAYGAASRARAAEAQRFEQVRSLARYMLFDLNSRLQRTPGNTAARVNLADKAQGYLSALAATPKAADDVQLDTARGFIRLARIQGVPPDPNFGDWAAAKASLKQADRLLDSLSAKGAAPAALAPAQAEVDAYMAAIVGEADTDLPGSEPLIKAAWAHLNTVGERERGEDWHRARRALRAVELELASIGGKPDVIERTAAASQADIAQWPAAMRDSVDAVEDRAVAAYWLGAAQSIRDTGDRGVAQLLKGRAALAAAEAQKRNDPRLLYFMAYNEYELFAAAARTEQQALSSDALVRGRAILDRLLAVEAADNALKSFAINMDESLAQDLGNRNRFAEAIAVQRRVIAGREAKVAKAKTDKAKTDSALGGLGWSNLVLGLIAKQAGDRALVCDSWTKSEALWRQLEAKKTLIGSYGDFLPGLRRNLVMCRSGQPLSAFKPLRS